MPEISVIIPIYNAEKYLEKTIKSVLNQTFKDFELILIDDGSKDSSNIICERAKAMDVRVRYESHENRGISYTRNRGIELACGRIITFCDHDDLYREKLLEDNYRLLVESGADFIKFGREMIMEQKRTETGFWTEYPLLISKKEISKCYRQLSDVYLLVYAWDALFQAEFIKNNNIKFDETMKFGEEDRNFMFECIRKTNSMIINPLCYYEHYSREVMSTSRKFSMNRLESIEKSIENEKVLLGELFSEESVDLIWQERLVNYLERYIDNLLKGREAALTKDVQNEMLRKFVEKNGISKIVKYRGRSGKQAIKLFLCKRRRYSILLDIVYRNQYCKQKAK